MSDEPQQQADDEERPVGIWVYSDVNPDGSASYIVTVTAGDDVALSLKADAAVRYVAAVYRAAVIAQHDAAVTQQLHGRLGLTLDVVARTVIDLRADREPSQESATTPLKFEPIVSGTSFAPYVHVWASGKRVAEWAPADCFQHAGQVMRVLAAVDLDSAYYRYPIHTIGIDEATARGAVEDLGNQDQKLRDPSAPGGEP